MPEVLSERLPDIAACEAEPIRYPAAVQPHGVLLVLDAAAERIEAVSTSCADLLGLDARRLLGHSVALALGAGPAARLRAATAAGSPPLLNLRLNGRAWQLRSGRNQAAQWLLDIEPAGARAPGLAQWSRRCRQGMQSLRQLDDLLAITQAAARLVRELSGFDRVMVYRFDADWNGEVLAEAREEALEPYLGLHFPAGDIPRQARELFQRSGLRQIADATYTPATLLAPGDSSAIDLGCSSLRSVSPLHLQYLKNMQVRATLVGSLVVDGRLWGLVSCQHKRQPRYLAPAAREELGWLCEDLAALIGSTLTRQRRAHERQLAQRRRQLVDHIRAVNIEGLLAGQGSQDLLQVVAADGFALLAGPSIRTLGAAPAPERIRELQRCRRERAPDPVLWSSHALMRDLGLGDADDGVAGALWVSVLQRPDIALVWFRRERSTTVRWGGDPSQSHSVRLDGSLAPRSSFAQFLQDVRGQAQPWSPEELESAAELGALIEIDALRERDAFVRSVLNSIALNMAVLDTEGRILAVNAAWRRFAQDHGAPALVNGSAGLSYRQACERARGSAEAAQAAVAWQGIEAVLLHRLPRFQQDYPCSTPGGTRWFRLHVYPMAAPAQGAVVAHEDITEQQQALIRLSQTQQQLRQASAVQARHLRELAGELTQAEQRERDRLYEVLHDEVQPLLVATRLQLSGLSGRTPEATVLAACDAACEQLGQILDATRTLSLQLSPPLIRERGLAAALGSLSHSLRRHFGLQLELDIAPEAEPQDPALRLLCFGVIRELLMNTIKHAGVDQAVVSARSDGATGLCITVSDEGVGFDAEQLGSGSGLAAIERRLSMFGGSLHIRSRPGQGAALSLRLPPFGLATP